MHDSDFFDRFSQAFGKDGKCYVGGDEGQELPGLMIHGEEDVKGSQEIVKGSGIYVGGIQDAAERVIEGKNNAEDFRFFVGRKTFEPGFLEAYARGGVYQPLAAPRTIALKQCIGLPLPLYHEVLGLAGGESKDVSEIEVRRCGRD